MGSALGCQREEEIMEKKSHEIDQEIAKPSPNMLCQKLLLLDGFTAYEKEQKKYIMYSNVVSGMTEICQVLINAGKSANAEKFMDYYKLLLAQNSCKELMQRLPEEIAEAIKELWNDPQLKQIFHSEPCFQSSNSVEYFLNNIDRISEPDFEPSNLDCLHARVATTGVVEFKFKFKELDFVIYDVGGQRSQRRKWIHFFDKVNGLIFVAAISGYDQTCREDNASITSYTRKQNMALNQYQRDTFQVEMILSNRMSLSSLVNKVTLHFVDNAFTRRNFVVGCRGFTTNEFKTADVIARKIADCLKYFELEEARMVAMVRDDAANMRPAASKLGIENFQCCAHLINLVVQFGIKNANGTVMTIIEKCRNFAKESRKRHNQSKFEDELNKQGISSSKIPKEITVRWNSTFFMLQSIEEKFGAALKMDYSAFKMSDRQQLSILVKVLSKFD
ncbi:unnamed protein product [Bursaphelenchus okinawaensis]|uniref:Uncharacterized protein n=1 Tax=Bursaphelenchus okinawaensis TaxID=465554 RepID=A0A811L4P8_9BILA|nr:unnamed protein product [Bursaphelenchus okinawaensis]CAG9117226.1 unnamed protein product [Bursaphelenchus okinawaensis]